MERQVLKKKGGFCTEHGGAAMSSLAQHIESEDDGLCEQKLGCMWSSDFLLFPRGVDAAFQPTGLLLALKFQERHHSLLREHRTVWVVHNNDSAKLLEKAAHANVSLLNLLE